MFLVGSPETVSVSGGAGRTPFRFSKYASRLTSILTDDIRVSINLPERTLENLTSPHRCNDEYAFSVVFEHGELLSSMTNDLLLRCSSAFTTLCGVSYFIATSETRSLLLFSSGKRLMCKTEWGP